MESLITMSEIARLANVQRQAVTNWRTRPASRPFPTPATTVNGVERFDRDDVLAWLEVTDRGNNREARVDAPAVIAPANLDLQRAVVLLCLRAQVAQDIGGLSEAQRIALAEEIDPQDDYLLREVREAGGDDDDVAVYVDELLEATFGPADALTKLYATRPAQGSRGLASEVITVLQSIAAAARTFLGPDGVAVDLRLEPRAHQVAAGFQTAALTDAADRAMLRHLALTGLAIEQDDGPRVEVVSVVGCDIKQALDRADEVALELANGQVAIILGAATVLCDRLTGSLYEFRRKTLAMGEASGNGPLAAAVRLPRGLWQEAHRQSLGLWVLRGGQPATGVMVADLSGSPFESSELADDVFGALEQTTARAYRYGRVIPYKEVWTRDTVVAQGIGAATRASTASSSAFDGVVEATLVTREPIRGFDVPQATRSATSPSAHRSLGELVETKAITLHHGTRIPIDHQDPNGTLQVLSADPNTPQFRLDRLAAAKHYGYAVLTEPGDVVFTASPTPLALVDEIGGSLVACPSRILRIQSSRTGIGPHALAAVINETATSREWKTWPVPHIPQEQVDSVENCLKQALEHHAELRRREDAMHTLIANLIHGVAEGSVALRPSHTERKAG